jgi:hypothetical protein
MSNCALSWAWAQSVSSTEKLVLLCLADHADQAGRCWPSLTRIQERTGLARSTVAKVLDQLEAPEPVLIVRARSKVFAKVNPDERLVGKMIEALQQQKTERASKLKRDGWAPEWKHPATWLNGECWQDEPALLPRSSCQKAAPSRPRRPLA